MATITANNWETIGLALQIVVKVKGHLINFYIFMDFPFSMYDIYINSATVQQEPPSTVSGMHGNQASALVHVAEVLGNTKEQRKLKKHSVVRVKELQMLLSIAILRVAKVSYTFLCNDYFL